MLFCELEGTNVTKPQLKLLRKTIMFVDIFADNWLIATTIVMFKAQWFIAMCNHYVCVSCGQKRPHLDFGRIVVDLLV